MFLGRIIAGGLLLVLGRKLFWLYVAILGFVTGLNIADRLLHLQPEWMQLLVGIGFGILGALLAYFFQEVAVAVAGFFAGAYVATGSSTIFGVAPGQTADVFNWILFFVGGFLGAFLAIMLFDWALIILTSVTGAMLLVEGLSITAPWAFWSVVGLAVVGVIIQAGIQTPRMPERRREITTPHTPY